MDPNFKHNAKENLKRQVEQNPGGAIVAAITAVGALGKFIQASAQRSNARSWKKEVKRREAKDKMKK